MTGYGVEIKIHIAKENCNQRNMQTAVVLFLSKSFSDRSDWNTEKRSPGKGERNWNNEMDEWGKYMYNVQMVYYLWACIHGIILN